MLDLYKRSIIRNDRSSSANEEKEKLQKIALVRRRCKASDQREKESLEKLEAVEKEEARREYKQWENKTKKIIRNKKNALERQIAKDSKLNPKCSFSFINSSRRSRSTIGPLKKDGVRVIDPKDQAELLNDTYSAVFTRCDAPLPPKDPIGMTKLSDIEVTEQKIIDEIERTREFSAPGPDHVTNKILIELKREIATPLTILFRKSLDESHIPDEWRQSNVTPVYKM